MRKSSKHCFEKQKPGESVLSVAAPLKQWFLALSGLTSLGGEAGLLNFRFLDPATDLLPHGSLGVACRAPHREKHRLVDYI